MARRVAEVFGLSDTELGDLFGVSRQAAAGWLATGFPADHRPKAAVILTIGELLAHYLQAGRIAGVVRRTGEAYGGRTMLEMIEAGEHEELLDRVRASFAFGNTS